MHFPLKGHRGGTPFHNQTVCLAFAYPNHLLHYFRITKVEVGALQIAMRFVSWTAGLDDMVPCAFTVGSMEGETHAALFIMCHRVERGHYGVKE